MQREFGPKPKFLFLKEDLEVLDKRIEELKRQVNELSREGGEMTRQTSETWHDNAPFEESMRQYRNAAKRLKELVRVRQGAEMVEPTKGKMVGIGKKVKVRDEVTGEIKEFVVGSYMMFGEVQKPERLSYEASFVKIVMGAKVGIVRKGMIGGKEKELAVLAVE